MGASVGANIDVGSGTVAGIGAFSPPKSAKEPDYGTTARKLRDSYSGFQLRIIKEQLGGAGAALWGQGYGYGQGQQAALYPTSAAATGRSRGYGTETGTDRVDVPLCFPAVGAQTEETVRRLRREGQQRYQQQLAQDQHTRPVEKQRMHVARRPPSPQGPHNLLEQIGETQEAAEGRRLQARMVLYANQRDILARGPSAHTLGQTAHNRADEIAKFESQATSIVSSIGQAQEDSKSKARKKALQEQYLQQLLSDSPQRGRADGAQTMHGQAGQGQDGQGGLDVLDFSSMQGLEIGVGHMDGDRTDKYLRQAEYRRLLDKQKMQHEDIVRVDRIKYGASW
mmetsp:Transcript_24837/g.55120  ORF Transcript_24837/g.55120 Transcript_24837/m.55120 type:complete len:339 (+) Transcript_24837:195-1211(+)